MRPIPNESASPPPSSDSIEFNIVSFNVLAESYLTPRSHPGLPTAYAEVAFDKNNRRKLLVDTLKRFCDPSSAHHTSKWDILALQELDLLADDEEILPALKSWGYEVVHTPADQRKDCCAVVFDKKKFRLVGYEVIKFDDLATLYANADQETKLKDGTTFNNIKPNRTNSELTGMVRSFLRRNCAILAQLENIWTSGTDKQSILVASVHLYWHPGYEYVKLCQAKYLMDRAHAMSLRNSGQGERIPTVICGDMNSKPGSIVHQYFVKGNVNAQSVAPWNYFWSADDEIIYCEDADDRLDGQDAVKSSFGDVENGTAEISEHDVACDTDVHNGITGLEEQFQFCQFIAPNTSQDKSKTASDINSNYSELQTTLAARRANNHISPQDYTHTTPTPSVKYMLDFTLNRFTRWLRILGIDARLETEEEEKERTTGQNM
jgi:mRNA deadenylase 3'-5' endonuclease subunit Ccr4